MSSYHEFGYTQNAQIKSGRIVNESINYTKSDSTQIKSQVENTLVLNDSSEASDVASVEIAVKDSTAIPNLTFETSSTGNKICTIEIPAEDPSDTNTYAIWQTSVSEVKVVDNTVASNDVATADAVAVATVETYIVSSDDLNIGTGIENNPHLISSKEQLITLRVNINNSETNAQYAGKYYKLISDIDISNEAWEPIGSKTNPFYGYFDGGNHIIIGLTDGDYNANNSSYGLFDVIGGDTGTNTVIKNLNIENAGIDSSTAKNLGILFGSDAKAISA